MPIPIIDPLLVRTPRSQDPDEADLFVVPAPATNMDGLEAYLGHVLRHVRRTLPYWNRSAGADHVWFFSGDHGGDALPTDGVGQGMLFAHYFKAPAARQLARHVNAAPYLGVGVTAEAEQTYSAYGEARWHKENARRRIVFFFAGNFALSDVAGAYSEGVRQALWRHHSQRVGFRVVEKSDTYRQDYRASTFCAAPLGEGWGIRLIWALSMGCIPVLFTSQVRPPAPGCPRTARLLV